MAKKLKPAGVLYADPPWPEDRSFIPERKLKGLGLPIVPVGWANQKYKLLSMTEIKEFPLPPLKDDCFLFLWTPFRRMHTDALETIKAWGFRYCNTGIVWVKMMKDMSKPKMLMGMRLRMCHEMCLLAVRGKPEQLSRTTLSALLVPPTHHSKKPDEMYETIERYANGPYTELFARNTRPGWQSIGDQL